LILIAVALFAALSYAITTSGRGDGGIDREQAEIAASQIVQYATSLQQAITRLNIINDCIPEDLSFHYDSDGDGNLETDGSDDYYNSGSSTDCYLFNKNGANLSYLRPKSEWLDNSKSAGSLYGEFVFSAATCIDNLGSADSDCHIPLNGGIAPLIIFLPYVNENICEAIARESVAGAIITSDNNIIAGPSKFTGNLATGGSRFELGSPSYLFGCALSPASGITDIGGYLFYSILQYS